MPVKDQFAEVIVNKAVKSVDRIFHYRVPQELVGQVEIGSMVSVPFGHQRVEGIIVGFAKEAEVEKTKEILSLLTPYPLLNKELIDLAEWIGEYYLCPQISVLKSMLPSGLKFSGKTIGSKNIEYVFLNNDKLDRVFGVSDLSGKDQATHYPGKLGPKQKQILNYLYQHNGSSVTEVLAQTSSARSSLKSLVEKDLVEISSREFYRDPYGKRDFPTAPPENLTEDQKNVLQLIEAEYIGKKRPVLMYGVTGSGKTEVYLRLIEKMLLEDKQTIVLVPEISLTPQMVGIFKSRLGERVAVLHSRLSIGERRDAWMHIARGDIRVVVGARSAVFAPCSNLGLMIMDEEHEQSYKQDNIPRFHTREVARERSRRKNALFLMGSATPSVETYYQALNGEFALVTLENRIYQRPMAKVDIVDMRQELRAGNKSIFSRKLQEKLRDRFLKKEQSLLFLNRRGYHTFVSCRSCGFVLQCPHCNISLTTHGGNSRLKCHYCGYSILVPKICPECGSGAIRHFGTGTERVEEEVKKILPEARVARADADTTSRKGSYDQIYFGVKNGEIDILVGTQMIAKGLDFPLVTLVGVISADMALHLPEMRAGERTFQLITQVSGRAGRGELQGEVVLQTYNPNDPTLAAAGKQDYQSFYQKEIEKRQISGYPPFGSMIRVLFSGEDPAILQRQGEMVSRYIKAELGKNDEILGPAPAPLEKIKDRYRIQMIIKTKNLAETRGNLVRGLDLAGKDGYPHKNIIVAVDVEPLNMM